MGLVHLTLGQMTEITGAWMGPDLATFNSVPELKPMGPHVQEAHDAVLKAVSGSAPTDPASKEFIKAEKAADKQHDHAYRSFQFLCRAYREMLLAQDTVDTDEVHAVDVAVTLLMPEGASGVRDAYLTEAGNAQRASELLGNFKDVKATADKLHLTKTMSGTDVLNLWFARASQLGDMERAKTNKLTPAGTGLVPVEARNSWVKVVSTVLSNLEHTQAPQAVVQKIRGPLDAAMKAATQKFIERRDDKKKATVAKDGKSDE